MKKIMMVFAAVVLISGCNAETREIGNKFIIPDELKDCKFFSMRAEDTSHIKVVRCPNSFTSTTYPVGKSTQTTVTIDGVEYTPVIK